MDFMDHRYFQKLGEVGDLHKVTDYTCCHVWIFKEPTTDKTGIYFYYHGKKAKRF